MSGQKSEVPAEVSLQSQKCAVINLIPYLDLDQVPSSGITIRELVNDLKSRGTGCDPKTLEALEAAIGDDGPLGNMKIVHTSSSPVGGYSSGNGTEAWKDDMIQACTVEDTEGNMYVSFRGTGDGRWPDNGYGLAHEETPMQAAAREYYDAVAEEYLMDAKARGGRITVTGHSKGGNEAQFVYMDAEHADLIDDCYSMDGQGFSEMALERFQKRWGAAYEERRSRMYSICGQDDFVNVLGHTLIPDDNTYYVKTHGEGVGALHALTGMLEGDQLIFTDGDGLLQQGEVGRFARKLSETIMALPPEVREGVCLTVMEIVDAYFDHQNFGSLFNGEYENIRLIGEIDADPLDYIDLLVYGIPALIGTTLLTEEGRDLLGSLIQPVLEDALMRMVERFGIPGTAGILALTTVVVAVFILPKLLEYALTTWVALFVIDVVWHVIERIADVAQKIRDCCQKIYEAARETIRKLGEVLKRILTASVGPLSDHVTVDTVRLTDYADRLDSVNRRIIGVDRRMDNLYWRVGLVGLYRLMKADILTGYSWRLTRCSSYLRATASDYNAVERDLKSLL